MKKFLSLTLALLLILSMTATAFADDVVDGDDAQTPTPSTPSGVTYEESDATTFTIKKTYNSENSVVVNETLTLVSTPDSGNPDNTNLTFGSLAISALETDITVNVPSYSKAGVYKYTISETAGNTAGVTYTTAVINVQVLVEYDNENHKLVIGNPSIGNPGVIQYIVKETVDGKEVKANTFENTFKSGSFTVEKDVTGNMANLNDEFEITVTLTSTQPIGNNITVGGNPVTPDAWTSIKDDNNNITGYKYTDTYNYSEYGGKRAFTNIPEDVTVTVVENDVTDGKVKGYDALGVFTRTTSNSEGNTLTTDTEFEGLTIADGSNTAIVVKNEKKTEVATGVSLDTVPYFLMLAVACVGMFLLLSKKRAYREN